MFVLKSLLTVSVTYLPNLVCTAGIESTKNKMKKRSNIIATILPNILSIRLIEFIDFNV